jgi:hypothetical protein
MAVIWGLDLREIKWSKFKNSYMWNNEYHLRRTKFIVYQIAMISCVVSESLGTAALSGIFTLHSGLNFHIPQKHIKRHKRCLHHPTHLPYPEHSHRHAEHLMLTPLSVSRLCRPARLRRKAFAGRQCAQ